MKFPHFIFHRSRLFEWMASLMMVGIAIVVAFDPRAVGRGGFELIAQIGITAPVLYVLGFSFGGLRLAALAANGMSIWWGPRVRLVASLVAAFLWSQMAYSLVVWSLGQNYFSLGVPIYIFLAVGEIISSQRAAGDATNSLH